MLCQLFKSDTVADGQQLSPHCAFAAGVFPDLHVACNDTCKLDWTRNWIRAHLRDAMRMNKPLILGGVGAVRPHTWRLQVLQLVQTEMERALQHGHPIGGVWKECVNNVVVQLQLSHVQCTVDDGYLAATATKRAVHNK